MRIQPPRSVSWACLLAVVACATAGPGYLPSLGPVALRFRTPPSPPSPTATKVTLPPLAMTNSVPEPTPDESAATAAPVCPVIQAISPEPVTIERSPANLSTNPVQAVTSENDVLTAASILRFFRSKASNGVPSSVVVPLGFTPAVPATPPSSTATYTTSP